MAGALLPVGLSPIFSPVAFLASGLALAAFRSMGAFLACGFKRAEQSVAEELLMLLLLLAWPWAQLEQLELLEDLAAAAGLACSAVGLSPGHCPGGGGGGGGGDGVCTTGAYCGPHCAGG